MTEANTRSFCRGVGLIELMIGLTLGLILIGGSLSILLANQQSHRAGEQLFRMQEGLRFSFELLAQELREAGMNACGTGLVVNVLNTPASTPWTNWSSGGITGYGTSSAGPIDFGTTEGTRITGTEAILIRSATITNTITVTEHNPNSAQFKLREAGHGLSSGDILMACDVDSAAIFQVSNANNNNVTIVHNTGSGSPGNCSKGLGYSDPPNCSANGVSKSFAGGGFISKLSSIHWYVGNNNRGGRSLYRAEMNGMPSNINRQEIVPDVQGMTINYLEKGESSYSIASAVKNWHAVVAVRVTLAFQSAAADGNVLSRTARHTIRLRNLGEGG